MDSRVVLAGLGIRDVLAGLGNRDVLAGSVTNN